MRVSSQLCHLIVQPNAPVSALAMSRPFVIAVSIGRRREQYREASREPLKILFDEGRESVDWPEKTFGARKLSLLRCC
jgi:hypothetical protein